MMTLPYFTNTNSICSDVLWLLLVTYFMWQATWPPSAEAPVEFPALHGGGGIGDGADQLLQVEVHGNLKGGGCRRVRPCNWYKYINKQINMYLYMYAYIYIYFKKGE